MGAAQGAFWPIPVSYLGVAAAAAGITLINLTGNSAGTITPILIGWIRHETGSFQAPIYALAGLMALAALIMIPLARSKRAAARS
jgi:cyanate permease